MNTVENTWHNCSDRIRINARGTKVATRTAGVVHDDGKDKPYYKAMRP